MKEKYIFLEIDRKPNDWIDSLTRRGQIKNF
jgi:hypothetical protein